MKHDYSAWYAKHRAVPYTIKYSSGIPTQFIPSFPSDNKPKFIPDKLLNLKQLTQR